MTYTTIIILFLPPLIKQISADNTFNHIITTNIPGWDISFPSTMSLELTSSAPEEKDITLAIGEANIIIRY